MFTEEQKKQLEAPLSRDVVSTRKVSGYDVSYIEGWFAIAEANRIFGFGNWDREIIYCKEVSREARKVSNQDGWQVGYEAEVRITVRGIDGDRVCRTGTGHGSGISKTLFDAIEGAAKEAETDAMKRALMTFGNPFGLALYDKSQKNVADTPRPTANALRKDKAWENVIEKIDAAQDATHLDLIMKEVAGDVANWSAGWKSELREYCIKTRSELQNKEQLGDVPGETENILAAG